VGLTLTATEQNDDEGGGGGVGVVAVVIVASQSDAPNLTYNFSLSVNSTGLLVQCNDLAAHYIDP